MGASVLWWGIISGGLFVPLFLLWFGPWFRRLNVQTFPEGMGKLFGERIGWLISAVFPAQLIGICIAEITATATAFYALGNKSIPFAPHCILLAVGLTILYIITAGLMQAAWMNLFNAVMLIVGSFIAVFATGSWLSGPRGMGIRFRFLRSGRNGLENKHNQFFAGCALRHHLSLPDPPGIHVQRIAGAESAHAAGTIRVGYPARRVLGCLYKQSGRPIPGLSWLWSACPFLRSQWAARSYLCPGWH